MSGASSQNERRPGRGGGRRPSGGGSQRRGGGQQGGQKDPAAEARRQLKSHFDVQVTAGLASFHFRMSKAEYSQKVVLAHMMGGETLIFKATYDKSERNIVIPGGTVVDIQVSRPNPARSLPMMKCFTADELRKLVLEKQRAQAQEQS